MNPGLSGAYAARGIMLAWGAWEFDQGIAELRHAIEVNPGYAKAHHWLGISLAALGKFDESIAMLHIHPNMDPELLNHCIDKYNGIVLAATALG